jgi:hypothetical protein
MASLTDRLLTRVLATLRQQSPVPPTDGEWNNNPSWGQFQSGLVPTTAGYVTSVATLDRSYGPPQTMTVALSRTAGRQLNSSNYDFKARVTWSVGAISRQCMLDWRDGCQFSVVASSIKIESVTETIDLEQPYSNGGHRIELGACFAAGNSSAPSPQYSSPWRRIPSSLAFVPPAFADAWLIQGGQTGAPLYTANTLVQVVGPVLLPFAEYLGTVLGPTDSSFIRFAAGLEQLRIVNSAAFDLYLKVVYRLAL